MGRVVLVSKYRAYTKPPKLEGRPWQSKGSASAWNFTSCPTCAHRAHEGV